MDDRARPSWRDLLAWLGHRPHVCWAASFLSFVALAAVAFFQYSQALFYRFDGRFILTHATTQPRWMAPGFDLSANFLEAIGDLWSPIATKWSLGLSVGGLFDQKLMPRGDRTASKPYLSWRWRYGNMRHTLATMTDGCASSRHMRRYREPFPVLLRPAIGVAPARLLSVRRGVTERPMDDGEVAHDADLYIMRLQILDRHRLRGVSRHRPASDRWCDRHRVYANSQLRRLRPPAFGSLLDAVVSICPVHGDDDHRRYSCCADS